MDPITDTNADGRRGGSGPQADIRNCIERPLPRPFMVPECLVWSGGDSFCAFRFLRNPNRPNAPSPVNIVVHVVGNGVLVKFRNDGGVAGVSVTVTHVKGHEPTSVPRARASTAPGPDSLA